MTGLAILGCGYVANMYRLTLPMHPELRISLFQIGRAHV